MTELIEKTTIACPLAQAAMQINHFFAGYTGADGNAHVPLRLPLHVPGRSTPLILEQVALASIVPDREPGLLTPRYRLSWTPATRTESYPAFEGELRVDSEDYDSFILAIVGKYEPPLGFAGAAFDFAVGRFVAAATARDLLERIRTSVESAFQDAEARKRDRATAAIAPSA